MYLALARKWRPQKFGDVLGQDHVVRTISNAISMNRVAHAYLFSGPRGVGKTSFARILAKLLNCSAPVNTDPCGSCVSCMEIKNGHSLDVIEIDGASNRRIDDVREIEEHVKFTPVSGLYKIYIIDEIHMLTKEAFNALLKTLEEPPKHVKFIFATTEEQKIPETIHSRCQKFIFRLLKTEDILRSLKMIAKEEDLSFTEDVFCELARLSEGSLRDAQSLMDQFISFCGKDVAKISLDSLESLWGNVSRKSVTNCVHSFLCSDLNVVLEMVKTVADNGQDWYLFFKNIVEYLRDLMILKLSSKQEKSLNFLYLLDSEKESALIFLKNISLEKILYSHKVLIKSEFDVRNSLQPRVILEMCFIKIIQMGDMVSLKEIINNLSQTPRIRNTSVSAMKKEGSEETVLIKKRESLKEQEVSDSSQVASYEIKNDVSRKSDPQDNDLSVKFLEYLEKKNGILFGCLKQAHSIKYDNGSLIISCLEGADFIQSRLKIAEKLLKDLWKNLYQTEIALQIQTVKSSGQSSVVKEKSPDKYGSSSILTEPSVQNCLEVFPEAKVLKDL